jgi:hypothetical protein
MEVLWLSSRLLALGNAQAIELVGTTLDILTVSQKVTRAQDDANAIYDVTFWPPWCELLTSTSARWGHDGLEQHYEKIETKMRISI